MSRKPYPDRQIHVLKDQARAIYDLQMREYILRRRSADVSWAEIAREINRPVYEIRKYYRQSIKGATLRAMVQRKLPYLPKHIVPPGVPDWWAKCRGRPKEIAPTPYEEECDKLYQNRDHEYAAFFLPPTSHQPRHPLYANAQAGPSAMNSGRNSRTSPARSLPAPGGTTNSRHSAGGAHAQGASASSPPGSSVSGELLEAPEIVQLRKDCLQLRKAMRTFSEIAELLGVSEKEARLRTFEALQELQSSEISNSDTERRLMIEQIDQMIAGIHAMSTGRTLGNESRPVVLEAIDRMLRLMKQKSDLLGLSAPPAVDIRIRLQAMADENGYDITDLEDIAKDVLAAHKVRLPEFRG